MAVPCRHRRCGGETGSLCCFLGASRWASSSLPPTQMATRTLTLAVMAALVAFAAGEASWGPAA